IAGGCGGVFNVIVGYPFDTVKVRLQTSSEYRGFADCVKTMIRTEGLRGFYRGINAPLLGVVPMWAISFWVTLPRRSAFS
ncbi:mitochondrial carrier domain-containing protein, partial [Chytriomyces sp. MP71]